nr:hypothetical protein Iba_chr03bCG7510 [Ipomoea batatas]
MILTKVIFSKPRLSQLPPHLLNILRCWPQKIDCFKMRHRFLGHRSRIQQLHKKHFLLKKGKVANRIGVENEDLHSRNVLKHAIDIVSNRRNNRHSVLVEKGERSEIGDSEKMMNVRQEEFQACKFNIQKADQITVKKLKGKTNSCMDQGEALAGVTNGGEDHRSRNNVHHVVEEESYTWFLAIEQ